MVTRAWRRASERQPEHVHLDPATVRPDRPGGGGRSGLGCRARPERHRGGRAARLPRPQRDHRREAAVALGARRRAAARPDEPDAGRGRGRQHPHRRGLDRRSSSGCSSCSTSASAPGRSSRRARASTRCRRCRSRRRGSSATGRSTLVAATEVVPGDIVQVEAGDIVPADGRIVRSATLEAQEAALTGESAPIAKDAGPLASADVGLGDRTNMLFQNTSVTRGTGHHRRHGDRHADPDGPDRDDAHLGDPHPVAAAERARLADQGARHHRLGRGRRHRRGRPDPGHAGRGAAAARHRDGDLGHPDRHAGVRLRPALDGRRSSWPRRRRSSRTSPTSRRSVRPARSTPTRPAP